MVDSLSCPFMNPYKTFLHCESVFNAKQYFLKRFIHGFLDLGSGNIFFLIHVAIWSVMGGKNSDLMNACVSQLQ